jgi:hypothetical protein
MLIAFRFALSRVIRRCRPNRDTRPSLANHLEDDLARLGQIDWLENDVEKWFGGHGAANLRTTRFAMTMALAVTLEFRLLAAPW